MDRNERYALLCIDWINEVVDPKGKVSGKGYSAFVQRRATIENVARAQNKFRSAGQLVVHVRVGFSPGYPEHPATSPLLGKAKELGAFALGQWGADFVSATAPRDGEIALVKHRVNAFQGTPLDLILGNHRITHLAISGVATDLAVESSARVAHDLDYQVTILSDCCAAASDADHDRSLASLSKLAKVIELDALALPQP